MLSAIDDFRIYNRALSQAEIDGILDEDEPHVEITSPVTGSTFAAGADILVNPERADVKSILHGFSGPVFLKGSRRYELETLIDGLGDQTDLTRETAA